MGGQSRALQAQEVRRSGGDMKLAPVPLRQNFVSGMFARRMEEGLERRRDN
jgi:hypothetical protein